jgi:hypothetical protein
VWFGMAPAPSHCVIVRASGRSSTPQQVDVALPSFSLTVREYWITRFRGQ